MSNFEMNQKAAEAIDRAEAFLFTSGAGMGVDSGLPDFRGTEGFWKAYPPFKERGLTFEHMANPIWFRKNPSQAWGFYGHRLNLYRKTKPHAGFEILKNFAAKLPHFVFTSNVDLQFQKAGFADDLIFECHGSFSHLQCHVPCGDSLWRNDSEVSVDHTTFLAKGELPKCISCGQMARPNILMFGDGAWISKHCEEQQQRFDVWLQSVKDKRLVVVEIGAGTALPTVRYLSERVSQQFNAAHIRINPRENQGPKGTISIAKGGLEGLRDIEAQLS